MSNEDDTPHEDPQEQPPKEFDLVWSADEIFPGLTGDEDEQTANRQKRVTVGAVGIALVIALLLPTLFVLSYNPGPVVALAFVALIALALWGLGKVFDMLTAITCVAGATLFGSLITLGLVPSWEVKLNIFLSLVALLFVVLRRIRGSAEDAEAAARAKLATSVEPSRRARKVMTQDEKLIAEYRAHPAALLPWWIGAAALIGLFLWSPNRYTFWVLLIGGFVLAVRVAFWLHNRKCFTDKRVFLLQGLLNERIPTMPSDKVTDMTLVIPWHSRLLTTLRLVRCEYGNYILESAGQKQGLNNIDWIPNVRSLYKVITSEMLQQP